MSDLDKFDYDPPLGFEDSNAYPYTGGNENVTREQMMRPHKQVRNYLNEFIVNLKSVFGAGYIGTSNGKTVQNELDTRPTKGQVLVKGNIDIYNPKGDYEPATVKYVKDTAYDVSNADMRKDVYDKNRNGKVDDSDLVNGFSVQRDVGVDEYSNMQIDLMLANTINIQEFNVVFLASAWTASESGLTYSQRIDVEGMMPWDCSMILNTENMNEEEKTKAFENMFIYEIQTFSGYIVATCIECPEVDLNIKLICFAKKEVEI